MAWTVTRVTVPCPICRRQVQGYAAWGVELTGRWVVAGGLAGFAAVVEMIWACLDRADFGDVYTGGHAKVILLGTPIRLAIVYLAWPFLRHAGHEGKQSWKTWVAIMGMVWGMVWAGDLVRLLWR